MKITVTSLRDFFAVDRNRKIILICGAVLMLILLFSSWFGEKKDDAPADMITEEDVSEIETRLEQRLCELISQIDGAGEVSVMITLDRTSTTVYERDEASEETADSRSGQAEVVLAGSAKEPLQSTTIMPVVRGAAVVCEGASDPILKERVANVVAKALNIGISHVYVTN